MAFRMMAIKVLEIKKVTVREKKLIREFQPFLNLIKLVLFSKKCSTKAIGRLKQSAFIRMPIRLDVLVT
ncbi:hypothetical protein N288_24710 [Bacillus infantis NRRL B-14911]|uniref:Uncharacterized protein n=1 Tax=Bacillus infantis NRRL B-14911 TaxID=1367477 RepID=U5LG04_9BACI|nr:hypothetical protein N288_24710 [Bacillus infantis NRRL B-14911]